MSALAAFGAPLDKISVVTGRLAIQQSFNVPIPAHDMKNQRVVAFRAVDDDVLANRKTTQAEPQIVIASTAKLGVLAEQPATIRQGINQPVGDLNASALAGNVKPDAVEFHFGFRRKTKSHLALASFSGKPGKTTTLYLIRKLSRFLLGRKATAFASGQ